MWIVLNINLKARLLLFSLIIIWSSPSYAEKSCGKHNSWATYLVGTWCTRWDYTTYYLDWDSAHKACVSKARSIGIGDKVGTGSTCATYRGDSLSVYNGNSVRPNPNGNPPWLGYYNDFFKFITISDSNQCQEGTMLNRQLGCIASNKEKEVGKGNVCVGNPINIITGNKIQYETVFNSTVNPYFLSNVTYNSSIEKWQKPYSNSLKQGYEAEGLMEIYRNDGKKYLLEIDEKGIWQSDPDVTVKLESITLDDSSDGWQLTLKDNTVETYSASGRLLSISKLGKQLITLSYDDVVHKTTATDNLTNTNMTLEYDASNADMLKKVTTPANAVYRFKYTDAGLLQYVSYPDDTDTAGDNPFSEDNPYREYHYEDANNNKLLTGITDERGHRYATWAYDSEGRAISSEHANTTEKTTLDYTHQNDADYPRVTVTNALGKQTTYHFEAIYGVRKVTKVEGHQSENCAAANQLTTYDENGFVASRTDWKGNLTTYVHNDRGLETSRTVADDTPDAQTITTQWHDDFNVPEKIIEPMRTETFTYDSKGQRRTITVIEQ